MARSTSKQTRVKQWLPIVGLIVGLAIIAYFPVTEFVDAMRRAQVANEVESVASSTDSAVIEELFAQAEAYNRNLVGLTASIPANEILPYEQQLSIDGHDTAFGYLIAPSLSLTMPIYRGTSDAVLSAGAGHLETSSLPIGGESTHASITGHSGMTGMRAFDDINQLQEGDVFGIKVYGRLICYRVTGSEVVLPSETQSLAIQSGKDLCTLITCTPYGVNSHRLLVHAERCEVPEGFEDQITPISSVISSGRVLPFLVAALAVAAVLGAVLVMRARNNKARTLPEGGRHART